MTQTRKEILQHVFDVLDIPPEAQTYLVETERIRSVPVLTANTNANFLGIRTRSDGLLSHTEAHQLQLFRRWYFDEYRNKEIDEPLTEYFTEDVWEEFLQIDTERSISTPRTLPNPPTFSPTGTRRRNPLTVDTMLPIEVTSPLPINTSPTADTLRSFTTTTSINTTQDVRVYPVFNGSTATWMPFKRRFIAVATAQKLDVLIA